MIEFPKADEKDIAVIQQLSREIWHAVYPSIVSVEQIEYMLDRMYSTAALTDQMQNQGHQFLIMKVDDDPVGFASYSIKSPDEPKRYRLHKLYLKPQLHGKGIGRKAIDHLSFEISCLGGTEIELNVNKKNPAIRFYEKVGFSREREEIIDIGHGYVMDDYIMVLSL